MIECKMCSEVFPSQKSLHLHLKKHDMHKAEYYCKYYPRYSLFHKKQIPFLNTKQYFETEFLNIEEFVNWEKIVSEEEFKNKCLFYFKKRIEQKNYKFAPCHVEAQTIFFPPIEILKKHFESYGKICKKFNIEPLYNKKMPSCFYEKLPDFQILIDTREQDPLPFRNKKIEKLYVGDYLLKSSFQNTFVDRKSPGDFTMTLSSGLHRFEKEIEKTIKLNGYIFVVVESSIEKIYKNNIKYGRRLLSEYSFHNMRYLSHKYPRRIQFIFTDDRNKSMEIIPKLLFHGEKLWQVDIQYHLDNQ